MLEKGVSVGVVVPSKKILVYRLAEYVSYISSLKKIIHNLRRVFKRNMINIKVQLSAYRGYNVMCKTKCIMLLLQTKF